MVNRNLIRDLDEPEWGEMLDTLDPVGDVVETPEVAPDDIVEGRVVRVEGDIAMIDVGYKSEGAVPTNEWEDDEPPPQVGDIVKVLVEDVEDVHGFTDDRGMLLLSKRKALKIESWLAVMKSVGEGDVVTGRVIRKIKGGLLVDIGVNVFLPASQVDIRRPSDIGDYIGRFIQCDVLKIDESRRNIVVSRRALIEEQRAEKKARLLKHLEEGQRVKGVVKNIADFGAFVDLGGIDGLLHITDMTWGRINHPSEMVSIDQEIEVDDSQHRPRKSEKIALGLKQMTPSPWDDVEEKYPVNTTVHGAVVNVMSYGAFVKLEEGIEGLVHISEMSWTKRISHPSELVQIGDEIDVVVLGINKEKQEISLGMKQTQENPWDKVTEKYPPGEMVKGTVRNLTNYGAFIEIEEGIDGLLHVSDMSWTRKVSHPSEVLEKGAEVECKVLSVDQQRRRIALGLKQLDEDPWAKDIPDRYQTGQLVTGKVTKITNFGVFVGLEDGLEGLLHISELADHKVENAEDVVAVGDEIEVKVLRVDTDERKIGLSRKRVEWAEEDEEAAEAEEAVETGAQKTHTATGAELKGGVGDSSEPLFKAPTAESEETAEKAESESTEEASADSADADTTEAEPGEAESDDSAAEESDKS